MVITIIGIIIPTQVMAASNSTSTPIKKTTTNKTTDKKSSHYEWCIKQKDKKTRSILCPDVFPKNETTIGLYG
jgi:hypothetical protein